MYLRRVNAMFFLSLNELDFIACLTT
jgi:hypothetical protein